MRTIIISICAFSILSFPVYSNASSEKLLKSKAKFNQKILDNIKTVGLVSVYGDFSIDDKKVHAISGNEKLRIFMEEKLLKIKESILKSSPEYFTFLTEQAVLGSTSFANIRKTGELRQNDLEMNSKKEISVNPFQAAKLAASALKKKDDGEYPSAKSIMSDIFKDYFVVKADDPSQDYCVYPIDMSKRFGFWGKTKDERKEAFAAIGCDAIYSVKVSFNVVPSKVKILGQRKGLVNTEVLIKMETFDGKEPYIAYAKAKSKSAGLFTSSVASLVIDGLENINIEEVIECANESFDLAWKGILDKTEEARSKIKK